LQAYALAMNDSAVFKPLEECAEKGVIPAVKKCNLGKGIRFVLIFLIPVFKFPGKRMERVMFDASLATISFIDRKVGLKIF
jgi:hypothetical protein